MSDIIRVDKGRVFHIKITSLEYEVSVSLYRFMKKTEFLTESWASAPFMEGNHSQKQDNICLEPAITALCAYGS